MNKHEDAYTKNLSEMLEKIDAIERKKKKVDRLIIDTVIVLFLIM